MALSVALGAATPIAWDAFTHKQGYGVELWPLLAKPIDVSHLRVPVDKWLQHGSTLLAGVYLLWRVRRQYRPIVLPAVKPVPWFWPLAAVIMVLIIVARFTLGLSVAAYGHWIVTLLAAGMWALLAASVGYWLFVKGIILHHKTAG
ncbi:MAG TPA: DUF4184 family protein [Phnomibacter sp.]|nr:DUF4184 family protein [Phnomibacter sp.]